MQYSTATAVLTTVLLFAFWIVPILDNVFALTMGALISDLCLYHDVYFTTSFEAIPLPKLESEEKRILIEGTQRGSKRISDTVLK
jgi:hypothetical protein